MVEQKNIIIHDSNEKLSRISSSTLHSMRKSAETLSYSGLYGKDRKMPSNFTTPGGTFRSKLK
jgi:hypothetical protein